MQRYNCFLYYEYTGKYMTRHIPKYPKIFRQLLLFINIRLWLIISYINTYIQNYTFTIQFPTQHHYCKCKNWISFWNVMFIMDRKSLFNKVCFCGLIFTDGILILFVRSSSVGILLFWLIPTGRLVASTTAAVAYFDGKMTPPHQFTLKLGLMILLAWGHLLEL